MRRIVKRAERTRRLPPVRSTPAGLPPPDADGMIEAMKSHRLVHQNAFITGGTSGAGAASVKALAEEGARVVFADRDADAGRSLETKLKQEDHEVSFVEADVSRAENLESAVGAAFDGLGGNDILFNHADIIIVKPFQALVCRQHPPCR